MTTDRAKTCRYHCTKCHRHFTSLDAFDEHVMRPGYHTHPESCARLRVQTTAGRCENSSFRQDGIDSPAVLWEYHYVPLTKSPRYQEEPDD